MVLNAKREKLLHEDFSPHFSSSLIYKDLHYLQDLARTLKRPLFTGSTAKELFGMTLSKGMEALDFSGIYKIMKGF
jgi:3-hydroxyisobutyrate dehydrogenase